MRIENSQLYSLTAFQDAAAKSLSKTNQELNKILERLSTALKINSAADNAAGFGMAEQLDTQVRGFKQASANVSEAMEALNIAGGIETSMSTMLQRQRDLALQSSNGTLTDEERSNLNTEYQSITQEINRISSAGQLNNTLSSTFGAGLLSGNGVVQAGSGAGDQINLPFINMSAIATQITGTAIDTAGNATTAMSSLDQAIDTLNSQRGTLGAMTNRFESTVNNLLVANVNTQAAESVLRDQDIAQALVDLTSKQLLQQSTSAAFARFNEISANNLFALLK